jgi:hypothetical protein
MSRMPLVIDSMVAAIEIEGSMALIGIYVVALLTRLNSTAERTRGISWPSTVRGWEVMVDVTENSAFASSEVDVERDRVNEEMGTALMPINRSFVSFTT